MSAIAQTILHVRVSDPVVAAARHAAEQRGIPFPELIRQAIRREASVDEERPGDAPLTEESFIKLILSPFGRQALAKAITLTKRADAATVN